MEVTEFQRKLDTMGRIMIPIKLREQLNLIIGKEYTFFLHEENGKKYICIECGNAVSNEELERARQLVQKYGM